MSNERRSSLQHLLEVWCHHQDLRTEGADIESLWKSRSELDQARLQARRCA